MRIRVFFLKCQIRKKNLKEEILTGPDSMFFSSKGLDLYPIFSSCEYGGLKGLDPDPEIQD